MTKTEAKRLVADLRRDARDIAAALTPTPEWILRDIGASKPTPEEVARRIKRDLDRIDQLSARLRAGLVEEVSP